MATPKASVSMKDVAALAGVSLGTVSNVVNTPDIVSERTRQRVAEAIAKLGWVPNESAAAGGGRRRGGLRSVRRGPPRPVGQEHRPGTGQG